VSLGAGTALLFFFVSPALLFLTGFYTFGRITWSDLEHGLMFDVTLFIVVSLAFHFALLPLSAHFSLIIFNFDLVSEIIKIETDQLKNISSEEYIQIFTFFAVYFVIVCAISFFAGRALIIAIERKIIPISVFHGAYYEIATRSRNHDNTVFVDILTKITRKDDQIVLYKGLLRTLHLGSGGKIDFVTLDRVERTYYTKEDDKISVREDLVGSAIEMPAGHSGFLVIQGEQIENIMFRTWSIRRSGVPGGHKTFDVGIIRDILVLGFITFAVYCIWEHAALWIAVFN